MLATRPKRTGSLPTPKTIGTAPPSPAMNSRRRRQSLICPSRRPWGAQQGGRVRRLSVLMSLAENDPEAQARVATLARGLRDLGWTEGRNLRIEYRGIVGGGIDRIRAAVAEVVASNPDVVHASNTTFVQELQQQMRSIPIVFATITDPVETGVVASLARPGANVTGFMNDEPALGGKWLELLKEVAPGVS